LAAFLPIKSYRYIKKILLTFYKHGCEQKKLARYLQSVPLKFNIPNLYSNISQRTVCAIKKNILRYQNGITNKKSDKSLYLMKVFLLSISLLLCGIASYATTWYISPTGNDATGNGTIGNPWRTLKKATATVTATGDIIHVNPGTYTETQQCFLAVGVSLEGDGITSVIKSTVTGTYVASLELRSPAGTNGNQHISNLKFDGAMIGDWAIWVGGRSNVSIYNCNFADWFNQGVIFSGKNDGVEGPPSVYATGNSFHHNIMNNCAQYNGYGRGCLGIGGQTGMLIYNNTITQNQRPAGQNGWPLKYNNDGYLRGVKIYNNTLIKNTFVGGEDWSFCLELFNAQGMEIYNNTIDGSLDFNYQGDKGTYPYCLYIHDNIINNPSPTLTNFNQEGIIIEYSLDGMIVENNTFNRINQGIVFYPRAGTLIKDVTIQKNLFTDIGTGQGQGYMVGGFGGGLGNYDVNNFNIYNNTAIASQVQRPAFALMFTSAYPFSFNALKVKNNILQGFSSSVCLIQNRTVFTNCQFQYNNLYANGDNINFIPTWVTPVTNFPASTTISNNISANPMFVGNGNYHLKPGSPMVDAGAFVGLPYAGAAPDRGYAELTAALPVKLVDFTATENNGKNILQWVSENEINSDYFSVERSSNGQNFQVIGRVNASGNTTSTVKYTFTDASPLTGINYYRLTMVDKDNSSEFSKIVAVSAGRYQSLSIAAAQLSSGKSNVMLTVASTKNQKANLVLLDANGRLLLNELVSLQKGLTSLNRNTPSIPRGVYYLRVYTTDENTVKNVLSTD
jgi:hypothetical protein